MHGKFLRGKFSHGKITTMCPVYNTIWMGTSMGDIVVYHATSITDTPVIEGQTNGHSVLNILHVEELGVVLLSNSFGQVWCYNDVVNDGPKLQYTIELPNGLYCYHMVKVSQQDEGV